MGVSGVPEVLYRFPQLSDAPECGVPVQPQHIEALGQPLQNYGVCCKSFTAARKLIAGTDPNPFLPLATWQWCQVKLHDLGFQGGVVDENECMETGQRLHFVAYIKLASAIELHLAAGATPLLGELPPPVNYVVPLSDQTKQAFEQAGEAILDGRPIRLEEAAQKVMNVHPAYQACAVTLLGEGADPGGLDGWESDDEQSEVGEEEEAQI